METATALREHPEIRELFQVLEENGLTKERQEVGVLIDCLEGMESQFGQVLNELKEVRGQLEEMQDRGIRAAAVHVLEDAESKVQEIGGQLALVKQNLVRSAKNAVEIFKEKGVDALRNAVSAMKIPKALSFLKKCFHRGAESMSKNAEKTGAVRGELQEAAEHMKNAGRVLIGKEAEEPTKQNPDKGILAKAERGFLSCGRLFFRMEETVEQAQKRIELFGRGEAGKTSVKAELKKIQSEKSGGGQAQKAVQEMTR